MQNQLIPLAVVLGFAASIISLKFSRKRSVYISSSSRNLVNPVSHIHNTNNQEEESFEIVVSPVDKFKFNAAHFIAFKGFRERLHGHNFGVILRLIGKRVQDDGYLMDFGIVKEVCGRICKELNEHFLLPVQSDVLTIVFQSESISITCEDGAQFLLPKDDVVVLPIVHSSVEEISRYLWQRIVHEVTVSEFEHRGVEMLEVSVSEMPHQRAVYRKNLFVSDQNNIPASPPQRGCYCEH